MDNFTCVNSVLVMRCLWVIFTNLRADRKIFNHPVRRWVLVTLAWATPTFFVARTDQNKYQYPSQFVFKITHIHFLIAAMKWNWLLHVSWLLLYDLIQEFCVSSFSCFWHPCHLCKTSNGFLRMMLKLASVSYSFSSESIQYFDTFLFHPVSTLCVLIL